MKRAIARSAFGLPRLPLLARYARSSIALALGFAIGCGSKVPVEDRLPPAPPLDRGHVDEGALGQVKRPSRLTADPAQEYDPAPSPDGTVIAFVSHRKGNADIFLRFLPGSGRVGEYPLVDHYAADNDPVWAPNGRQIAFVSRRDDPKGDLYIHSLKSGDAVPDAIRDAIFKKFGDSLSAPESGWDSAQREQLERVSEFLEKRDPTIRLIDAERENRGPAWSPDGRTVYYAARKPGEPENVWAIELRSFDRKQVTTDGGFDPAPSPDGKRLAYTARHGARTVIRVRDLEGGKTVDLTGSDPRTMDGFPAWSSDGKTVLFSRYADDTNEDGKVDVNDRPSIHAAALEGKLTWPVSPAGRYDLFPSVAGGRLFWSSDDGTNTDVWSIPEKGIFPALATSKEEVELADSLAGESSLRLLLLEQIAAKRPGTDPIAQDARIAAARLRADRRELDAATETAKSMLADARVTGARKARTQILLGRIATLRAERSGPGGSVDKPALRAAADLLEKAADSFAADLKAQKAEALLEAGWARAKADDRLAATESWQKAVQQGEGWPRAEAWLAAAMAYGDLGQADRSVATFLAALQAYPELLVPAERRADIERERKRLLDRIEKTIASTEKKLVTAGIDASGLPDVGIAETYGERAAEGVAAAAILGSQDGHAAIAALRDLANRHKDLPVLPSLARNEIGDLYVRLGDLESASLEYAAVADGGGDARQVQRARLSGAKALLIAGHYEQAVKALGPPPPPEIPGGAKAALARRARKAYTRTLLAKADEEFRSKDVTLARKSYRAVLAVDAREVRAHRGLIACYAALGEADRVAQIYDDESKKTPEDALIRYGVGLAYTYRSPEAKWMPKAEQELRRAVFLDDTQVFPHQTLGFVYEKQEELFGEKDGFERAADQYLLALSLNDVRDDFRNEADLLLNAGNAFFNLANYRRAYEYYARREKSSVPFDVIGRELVFRERIAKASFESNRIDEAVARYDVALQFLDAIPESDRKGIDVAEHRARLLDERAFAFDQGRQPAKAAEAYLDAAKANSIAGNEQNSARALRNAAINLFEKGVGDSTAGTDKKALVDALAYLEESLAGVAKHGVVAQKEKKGKKALFSYNMNMSLSLDGSEAVEGFSKQGEQELIFTFVGRIYESLDDPQRARELYEKKKSMLPKKVPAEQQASLSFKRALLENQIGVLAYQTGDIDAAWNGIRASYDQSLSIGNVHGGMTNAANLALIAIDSGDAAKEKAAVEVSKDALSLLAATATPDPERYYASLNASKGELLVREASRTRGTDVKSSLAAFGRQQKLLSEAEKAFLDARSAVDGAKKLTPTMNRDRVVALRGLGRIAAVDGRRELGARHYAEAKKAAWTHGMDALALQIEAEGLVLTYGAPPKKDEPKADPKDAPVVTLADPANAKAIDERLDAILAKLEKIPAPILGRELDHAGIEPYYRRLAARALEAKDAAGALAAMERLRALQLVARAGGIVPKGRGADVETAAQSVREKTADVMRAQNALLAWTQPAVGREWEGKRAALDAATESLAMAVEEWGSWDEVSWGLAHVAPAGPGALAIAVPADVAFLYYVATPDALWTIACQEGECSAEKIGPSPSRDANGARASAAKALSTAAAKTSRVLLVPDAGLYDGTWIPAESWKGKAFSVLPSAAAIVAADAHRGPYRERQDVASTAGAVRFLAAAPRADVLRLDVPGKIAKGRPLASHWELTSPDGPPPVRRVTAKDVLVSGMQPAAIVADIDPATADPETMLALSDLWIRAGAGTVVFYAGADTQRADKAGRGEIALAEAAPLLLSGHPGMTPEELTAFGDEAVGSTIGAANTAMNESKWDDAMASLDRALYLIDALKVDGPKTDVLGVAAIAAYNAQEWVRGERYASELVKALEAKGDRGPKHADTLVLRGIMEQRSERFDAAVVTLNLAAQRYKELGIPEGLSRSLTSLGATFEKKLDAKQAVETFRSAMSVEEELGRTSGIGDLHRKIGRVQYLFLEDYSKAEEQFTKAREAYVRAKDAKGEDEARLELGLVAERRGALDESRIAYQAVYDRAAKRKDSAVQGKAALYLANTAWLSGDYQTAFARVREVRRSAEESIAAAAPKRDFGAERLAFLARVTEGLIYWTLNDLPRAISLEQEALVMAEKLDPLDVASVWNNLGIIHRSGARYDEALKCFETALAIDKKVGSRWGQAYDLRNLGLTFLLSEQPGRAGEPLQEAVALAASIGDKVNGTKATLALADFHRIQGDTAKSRALYAQAVAQAAASHLPEVKWRAHRGLATIAGQAGDHTKSRAELDLALKVVEELRGAIKVEELKNGFIADKLDLYDDAIALALEHPPAGADKATLSWSYSERSRARSFIDLLANRKVDLSDPQDTKRIGEQRRLKDQLFAAEDALVKAPEAEKAKKLAELEKLRERYRDLLVEIRAANPKLSAFVTVEPPSLADVRKVIGTDTALVEYHVGAKETLVWTITAETIVVRRIKVGRDALSEQVKSYLHELEAVRPVDARSRQLHDLLVAPALGPETKGKRYVGIIPHGVLHYVPFAAMKGESDYLIDRYALFYVPSAAVLPLTASTKASDKALAKVLAIGNPDLGDPSYALPFAELEVGDLKLDFPQIDVLTRERATDKWVSKNIGSYQVIHFACHGEFDPVNPLFSSLRLAREDSDGALEAHEIFGLPLRAELVTLSACRTGLGKIEAGDELIGLNRAFLYAGTRSIMSTLWRVHDGSTAVLVKHFYRGYAREPKADALRGAMRQVRDYYPHPAYWAAFALTGEYR